VTEPALAQKKVLVVEDDAPSQYLMQVILQDIGCGFEIAGDGLSAVELARNGKFDLVLMDLRLPGLNGYEASKAIRAAYGPGLIIVAVTAHAMEWVPEKCHDAGIDGIMTKPVDVERLKILIRRWLLKGRSEQDPSEIFKE
jgi:CheY-like chemotaxis protein